MTLRSVILSILSLLALIFLILNWQGITAPVPVNLIVEEIQAPLGLILLVILGGLWLFGIAWALMQQASTLVEIRKAYKEANANKSLADHAEMSRLEQMKEAMSAEMNRNREDLLKGLQEALAKPTSGVEETQKRLDAVEKALLKLTLRLEQLAEKAQIGPAPELPEPEPETKRRFFGFLGAGKTHKDEPSVEEAVVKAQETVEQASPETKAPEASTPPEADSPTEEKTKPGFFKKVFH